ncbi:membrane dipeptidase [Poseidonocella pacifica]|uniref:Membrane dipeptidase n=1 Tax=Poseidonocella pacifica TaxID=871651 RepID=A0A1I0VHF8_9RHOB|nr:dipeptidase [Poseidonocella pacifica]SFA75463.1 membrane dipeptidase [Poseidonocella pacifica]
MTSQQDAPQWPTVFDGHNDLLLRMMRGQITAENVADGLPDGHIDLPRARDGGFGGGFFAIFVPSPSDKEERYAEMQKASYRIDLPDPVPQHIAEEFAEGAFAAISALEAAGAISVARSSAELYAALKGERMAAIIHMEGAEAIGPGLEQLADYHARGLRSLGPVWSRPTIFAEGVPFAHPATPDIGGGLTDAGRALISECNRLGIMIDLSHLNEKGFDDVAAISDAPLVATHSNAWSVTRHARNLTDRQLEVIAESDGMVGINFASAFLRPDGRMQSDVPVEDFLRHLDHLIDKVGEDRVGFGSDFDGALVPDWLVDCAGLPNLWAALSDHGIGARLRAKLGHENWLRVLSQTWKD